MAARDYILCKDCDCKVIYDGYDNARESLEQRWGDPDADEWTVKVVRCPPCEDKMLAERDALKAVVDAAIRWKVEVIADDDDLERMEAEDELIAAVSEFLKHRKIAAPEGSRSNPDG